MLAAATETWKSLKVICSVNIYSSDIFYVTFANADIGSLKYHLLFLNKYMCHRLAKFEHHQTILTT